MALDSDGNVYVTDTLNNRVEIFDADGNFISLFGKNGDGPGTFAPAKGIALDADGHIWVADEMQDRLQVFNREGQLLTYIGLGHGELPGQFKALVGVAIDKQNRVFATEQYPGRVQMFRYVTDAEAAADKAKYDEESRKPPLGARRQQPGGVRQAHGCGSAAGRRRDRPHGRSPSGEHTAQDAAAVTPLAAGRDLHAVAQRTGRRTIQKTTGSALPVPKQSRKAIEGTDEGVSMALRATLRHERRAAKDPGFRLLQVTFNGPGCKVGSPAAMGVDSAGNHASLMRWPGRRFFERI